MAKVSPRTLRYYDEIGLLKPARINSSGYRIYGEREVDRLQQILFYRALGIELAEIIRILDAPGFDSLTALKSHREQLLLKKKQIDDLINTVTRTIESKEGKKTMEDHEKFKGLFKTRLMKTRTVMVRKSVKNMAPKRLIKVMPSLRTCHRKNIMNLSGWKKASSRF